MIGPAQETMMQHAQARAAIGNRGTIVVILVTTLAAAGLRIWQLGARELWLDESYSAWFSAGSWRDLWVVQPTYETHPPFYYSLLKLWRCVGGDTAAALRFPSAAAGVAAVPLIGLAARELAALVRAERPLLMIAVACLLAALSPRLLTVGQEARPYALLFLAYSGAIYGWLRLAGDFRGHEPNAGRWSSWAILGLGTMSVLWLHGLGLLYAAALFVALLITATEGFRQAPGRARHLLTTSAIVVLLYIPCVYLLTSRAADWGSGWLRWNPDMFPLVFLTLFGLQTFEEQATPLVAMALVPGLCILAVRSIAASEAKRVAWGMALLVLMPPLVAAAVSQMGMPIFLPRTQIGILAPIYLLCGLALAGLPAWPRAAGIALLGAIVMANLLQATRRPPQEPWAAVASLLRREMRPGDVIWVYPNDRALPLRAILGATVSIEPVPAEFPALDVPGRRPAGSPAVVAIDAEAARAWRAAHVPAPGSTAWLVRQRAVLFDPGNAVAGALATGRQPGVRLRWIDIDVQPLRPLDRRPAAASQASAR